MKHPIKFRFFDKEENRYVYPSFSTISFCDPDLLEAFTGLHDKNGVEIYENDIVKHEEGEFYSRVAWQTDYTGYYPFADCKSNCGCCGSGTSPNKCTVVLSSSGARIWTVLGTVEHLS